MLEQAAASSITTLTAPGKHLLAMLAAVSNAN
jgi:hypothetical protein